MGVSSGTVAGDFNQKKTELFSLILVFILVFIARLHFQQISLWEWDEYLFAASLYDYNLAAHIPHPPGFPLWVVLIRLSHKLFHTDVTALVLVNVLCGSLTVFPLYHIFRQVAHPIVALSGVLLYVFNPAVWAEGEGGFSDTTGLFWFILALAALMRAERNAYFYLGCFLMGIALGIRTPDMFLGVFILIPIWQRLRARDFKAAILGVAIVAVTCLAWLIPTAIYGAGSIKEFIGIIRFHANETATGEKWGTSLQAILARKWVLHEMLVSIWAQHSLALLINTSALVGLAAYVARKRWRELFIVFVLFFPYFVFAFLVLEFTYLKYALPFIPLVCFFASAGIYELASQLGPLRNLAIAAGLVLMLSLCAHSAYPMLKLLHGVKSPIVQAMEYIRKNISPEKAIIYYDPQFFSFVRHELKSFTAEGLRYFRWGDDVPPKLGMDAYVLTTLYAEPESTWRLNFKETSRAQGLLGSGRLDGFFNNVWINKTNFIYLHFVPVTDRTYRWMPERGVCFLKNNLAGSDKTLSIGARVPVSLFPRPPRIAIYLNDQPLDEFYQQDEQMEKVYSIPGQLVQAGAWSKLEITTDQTIDSATSPYAQESEGLLGLALDRLDWADADATASSQPAAAARASR